MFLWNAAHALKSVPWLKKGFPYLAIIAGCFIISIGLELFLLPNQVTTGGITGVSILVSHMTEMKLSLLLFLFNLPFITYTVRPKAIRLPFVIPLVVVGIFTYLFHPVAALVDEPLAAALFGGTCLGIGSGIVLRYGGRFDEPESAVKRLPQFGRTKASIIIFMINIAILIMAGAVFGVQQAVYSILAHSLAYCMIEAGFSGLTPYKRFLVRSKEISSLQHVTSHTFHIRWISTAEDNTAFCIVHRADVPFMRERLKALDPNVQIKSSLEYTKESAM
ncbi:YitT family protein [Paenibacillus xylaniclasticus]|uniref:YitT family protein n=1 Tax=Paenibacillus xylaniclasticus TaxID=588083 RepID=UPI0013E0B335|nr:MULTISPECIES: YitT family protein [Paenibacillus]GFN31450.1 membrane protein [Paenibacillus curdlanolyticus]